MFIEIKLISIIIRFDVNIYVVKFMCCFLIVQIHYSIDN